MRVKVPRFCGKKCVDIHVLEFGQRLRVLASIVNKVVKTVGEERGGSSNSLVDAGLVSDVELNKLEGFGVLSGQSSKCWGVGIARSGDNEVGGVLELLIREIGRRNGWQNIERQSYQVLDDAQTDTPVGASDQPGRHIEVLSELRS